jgi:predicted restriction endonuclease
VFASQAEEAHSSSEAGVPPKVKESPVDEIALRAIKSRRGQPEFRKSLLLAFNGKCCISGCAIESVLEAAHIVPHTEETNYAVENGVLLRADIHTLYDLNVIGIDSNGRTVVSDSLKESEYWQFHGKLIAEHISETMSSNLSRRFRLYEGNS